MIGSALACNVFSIRPYSVITAPVCYFCNTLVLTAILQVFLEDHLLIRKSLPITGAVNFIGQCCSYHPINQATVVTSNCVLVINFTKIHIQQDCSIMS